MSNDKITEAVKAAANAAGLIDMDWLGVIDVAGLGIDAGGNVTGADAAIAMLKDAKPYLFPESKHAKDLSDKEWVAIRKRIAFGQSINPPEPAKQPQKPARAMTEAEIKQSLRKIHMKGR